MSRVSPSKTNKTLATASKQYINLEVMGPIGFYRARLGSQALCAIEGHGC